MTSPRHHHTPSQQAGFSLIEMIMALVLLGILGAIGLSGFSNVMNGFVLSRDAATTAGKGQLAMLRLARELRVIESVDSVASSNTSLTFVALHDHDEATNTDIKVTYTVTITGDTITLNDGTSTDVLSDQVSSLTFAYYDNPYSSPPETTWSDTRSLIQVTIVLNGPNGSQPSFTTRMTPVNTPNILN